MSRTIPRMVDSHTAIGERREGFMPTLMPLLGAGSFDDHEASPWFQHLLASGSRLGCELVRIWNALQQSVVNLPNGSTLSTPAADAGQRSAKVQAALPRVLERDRAQRLDVDIRALVVLRLGTADVNKPQVPRLNNARP